MQAANPVLVANGPVRWTADLAALAAAAEPLLAADGGANQLGRIGLRPAAVIGDLDSITPGMVAFVGSNRLVPRPDQERPDLEKALGYALDELGLDRLTVLGATGGRLDHAVVNLGLLARRAMGESLVFLAPDLRAVAVAGEAVLAAAPGELWSFFSFDPAVRVSLAGVRWPVAEAALDLPGRPSISNEATGDAVTVSAAAGAVVAMRWLLKEVLSY
jgi:thiamine pyrophosphokinase